MGFYFRKSLNFGPVRFNLSKSGIGVSTGFKGFRIGTGPRGNYIQAGMGGIYYRKTLSSGSSQNRPSTYNAPDSKLPAYSPAPIDPPDSINRVTTIDSASAINLVDQNSADLLAELNTKYKLIAFCPFFVGFSVFAILYGLAGNSVFWYICGALLGLTAVPIYYGDQQRKTTLLFYNLEPPFLPAFEAIVNTFEQLSSCHKIWVINSIISVSNKKYQAGADNIVDRSTTKFSLKPPPYIQTNISIPCMNAGKQKLYLFPERILIYDANGIGAANYASLMLNTEKRQHICNDFVPNDAKIVRRTWRYVNKDGGPDRRFNNNPEIPIAEYEHLRMSTDSGLNELFQFSRCGFAQAFIATIKTIATTLSNPQVITTPHTLCQPVYPEELSYLEEKPKDLEQSPIIAVSIEESPNAERDSTTSTERSKVQCQRKIYFRYTKMELLTMILRSAPLTTSNGLP